MSKRTFTQSSFSDDATYRAHILAIHDAIIAAGWVQTSDTGQLNYATVSKPTSAANVVAGYALYRMNDALHTAGSPVILRLAFITLTGSNASGNSLGIQFQVGFATNGAGTFTGNASSAVNYIWVGTTATPGTNVNCYSAGDGSFLTCALLPGLTGGGGAGYGSFFSVERSRDNAGADTADGVYLICGMPMKNNGGTSIGPWGGHYVPRSGSVPAAEEPPLLICPNSSTTGVLGADVGVFPCYPTQGILLPPALGVLGYMLADVSQFSEISVTRYGTAHNYLALGIPSAAAVNGGAQQSSQFTRSITYSSGVPAATAKNTVGLLMRYE